MKNRLTSPSVIATFTLGLAISLAAAPALADGGGGVGRSAAVDFFGYFLAGGNPFAAVREMDEDEDLQRTVDRWSKNLAEIRRQSTRQQAAAQPTAQSIDAEARNARMDNVLKLLNGRAGTANPQTAFEGSRAISFPNLR